MMRRTYRVSAIAVLLTVALGGAGCAQSGGSSGAIAVRVGPIAVTSDAVERWMHALAPDRVFPAPPRYAACIAHEETLIPGAAGDELRQECARGYQELKRQALELLIVTAWIADEGARLHIQPSISEVRARADEQRGEWQGVTAGDVESLARAQLLEGELKQRVKIGPITDVQVRAYFRRHVRIFERPERRYISIAERFPTRAAALKFMAEVAAGRPLSSWSTFYHESFSTQEVVISVRRPVMKDLFATKPHVLVGPESLNGYSVFEVTRISPRWIKPLGHVRAQIVHRIADEEHKRALIRLIAQWRARWLAQTDCSKGFIVQKCSQYRGPVAGEPATAFS